MCIVRCKRICMILGQVFTDIDEDKRIKESAHCQCYIFYSTSTELFIHVTHGLFWFSLLKPVKRCGVYSCALVVTCWFVPWLLYRLSPLGGPSALYGTEFTYQSMIIIRTCTISQIPGFLCLTYGLYFTCSLSLCFYFVARRVLIHCTSRLYIQIWLEFYTKVLTVGTSSVFMDVELWTDWRRSKIFPPLKFLPVSFCTSEKLVLKVY